MFSCELCEIFKNTFFYRAHSVLSPEKGRISKILMNLVKYLKYFIMAFILICVNLYFNSFTSVWFDCFNCQSIQRTQIYFAMESLL